MDDIKQELVKLLNDALKLEHAARIQYLAHAELVKGVNSEKVIERLTEIASDEAKHEEKFRKLIGDYLGGEPAMELAPTHRAQTLDDIFKVNMKGEKEAIDFYKTVYKKILDNKNRLQYEFETLEHELRHIIIDEQEHVIELARLLGE
jgi:bacterioferritin (cytochrome b1)